MWQLKVWKDISTAEVPPEEQEVPAPHQAPQLGASVPKRGTLTPTYENQQGLPPYE